MMFFQIRPLNVAITVFVFQSALCSYEISLDSEPWSPKRNYRPLDYMIDITNRLGVNVLYEHNFLNDNNIAFSPYGLTGILVALYEGVEGYSALQIRDTMQIPADRNILRVGFRDIHRKLRSYFIPEEGFLAGLSFNNENITFRQNYLDILRYYGYDFEMPTPRPTNSEAPPVSQMSEAYSTYTSSIQPQTEYDEGMYTTRNYQTTSSAPFTTQFQTTTRQQTTKTTPSVPLTTQFEMSTKRRNTETTAYIPQTTQPVVMTMTTTRKVIPTTTPVPFTPKSTVTMYTTLRKDPVTTTYVPQTTQPTTATRRENVQTTSRVPQTVDNRFSGSEESTEITPAVTITKPEITTRQETTNNIPITTQTTTSVSLTTQTTTPVPTTTQTTMPTTTPVPSTTKTTTPTTTPVPSTTKTTTPTTTPVPLTTQTTTPVPLTTQSTTTVSLTTQSTTSVPLTTQTTSVPLTTISKFTTPTLETRFSDESDESTETTAVPTQQTLTTKLTTSTAPLTTEYEEVKTTVTTSIPVTTQTVKPTIQSTVSTTSIPSTTQSVETIPLTTIKTTVSTSGVPITKETSTTVRFSNPTSQSETTKFPDMSTQSESDMATLLITRSSLSAETIQSDSTIFIGNSEEESSLESKEDPTTESVKTTITGSQKTSSEETNFADNDSAMNMTDDGEPTTNSRESRSTKDMASSVMSTFDNTLTPNFQTTLPTTIYTKLSNVSSTSMRTTEASLLGPLNDSSNDIDDGDDSEVSSETASETESTDSNEPENNSTERVARSIDRLETNPKTNPPVTQTSNLIGDLTTLENSTKGMTLMREMFSTVEYTNTPVSTIDGISHEDDQALTTEGSTIDTFIETTEDYKITVQVKNTEKLMSVIRTKRSLQKLKVFAPFFLDHLGFYRPVYRSPSYNDGGGMQYQNFFMANGYNKVQITYMTYDTILEFAYISYLKSMAVKLPLDTSDYYLLIILPDYKFGINDLIRDMRSRQAPTLRDINNMLGDTHVRAWVPAFMLKGLIVLTTDLQKLGICDVFEPRQDDFKPMTDQRNIYARNIEQAITVTIRKYMEPSVVKRNEPWRRRDKYLYDASGYAYNRPPVEFAATHPFLFFVMDSSLHVALMAGKIMNPLNSRIL